MSPDLCLFHCNFINYPNKGTQIAENELIQLREDGGIKLIHILGIQNRPYFHMINCIFWAAQDLINLIRLKEKENQPLFVKYICLGEKSCISLFPMESLFKLPCEEYQRQHIVAAEIRPPQAMDSES